MDELVKQEEKREISFPVVALGKPTQKSYDLWQTSANVLAKEIEQECKKRIENENSMEPVDHEKLVLLFERYKKEVVPGLASANCLVGLMGSYLFSSTSNSEETIRRLQEDFMKCTNVLIGMIANITLIEEVLKKNGTVKDAPFYDAVKRQIDDVDKSYI